MTVYPVTILSAVDTASQTGAAQFTGQTGAASFIPVFGDATATGTVKIQGSNDAPVGDPKQFIPSTAGWADIPNATSAIASGVGPAIVISTLPFQYVRAVYTRVSGGSTTVMVKMSSLSISG